MLPRVFLVLVILASVGHSGFPQNTHLLKITAPAKVLQRDVEDKPFTLDKLIYIDLTGPTDERIYKKKMQNLTRKMI